MTASAPQGYGPSKKASSATDPRTTRRGLSRARRRSAWQSGSSGSASRARSLPGTWRPSVGCDGQLGRVSRLVFLGPHGSRHRACVRGGQRVFVWAQRIGGWRDMDPRVSVLATAPWKDIASSATTTTPAQSTEEPEACFVAMTWVISSYPSTGVFQRFAQYSPTMAQFARASVLKVMLKLITGVTMVAS